jgi:uncharacterized membrane protein
MQPEAGSVMLTSDQRTLPYKVILALAAGGIAETAYLTLSKLLAAPVACPLSGSCDTVLSSGYAELFGVPLSAFGLAAYSAAALTAFLGLREAVPRPTARLALLATSTVLASCSSYLLFILFTQFQGDSCVWCLTSAGLSLSILGTVLSSFSGREAQDVAAPSLGLATAVLAFLGFAFSGVEGSSAGGFDLNFQEPTVTRASPPGAADLAKRLKGAGAQMYGAFWCSHCFDQKQAFGKDAMGDFPYVECYPDGFHQGSKLASACSEAGLQNFPTWIIKGEKLEGEQSFDTLEGLLAAK